MRSQPPQPFPAILLAALTGLFMTTWSHDGVDGRPSLNATATDRRAVLPVRDARPLPRATPAGQPLKPFPLQRAAQLAAAATLQFPAAAVEGHRGPQAAWRAGAACLRGAALTDEHPSPGAPAARIASSWLLDSPAR
jgi:hypothetical protein